MKKTIFYLTSIFLILFTLNGCQDTDLSKIKNDTSVKTGGTLILIGNVPFQKTALQLKDSDLQVQLLFKTKEELNLAMSKIGKKVKVEGILKQKTKQTADGKITLKDYKIIVDTIKYKRR